jgi:LPS sulfotransferase NodH
MTRLAAFEAVIDASGAAPRIEPCCRPTCGPGNTWSTNRSTPKAPVGQPQPAWPPPTGPPRYDYELIAALEALIAESETGWRQLYDELGLTPYQVVYEELSTPDGYEQTIRGVLAHLGLDDYGGPIPAPRTRRQSNDLNEAWVAAYLTDRTSRPEH